MVEVTRRDVLRMGAVLAGTTAGAALLTACTGGGDSPAPTEPGGPEDPDRGLRAEIGRSEAGLIALYAAATAALTGPLAQRVAAVGERHPAYRQAIDPDRLADAEPTADEGTTPSAAASSPAPTLPADPAEVLVVLAAAERAAAEDRARQCVQAVDGELTRVIALAGAGSAAAAAALGRGRA